MRRPNRKASAALGCVDNDAEPPCVDDDDAESASLDCAFAFTTAPTAGELIKIYMRRISINGTDDESTPSADNQQAYVGSVAVDNVGSSTTQYFTLEIDLVSMKTSQEYEMYIENDTSETIDSGWTIDITPTAPGPHP